MFTTIRECGTSDALERFGLNKEARDMTWFKKLLERKKTQQLPVKVAIDWSSAGQFAKRMLIGDPHEFVSQLGKGQLHKPGGMWRESLKPRGVLDALMLYGMPAFGAYQAFQAPPEQRGSALGNVAGGAIGGFAGMPLGMVGSTVGSNLVGRLGQSVGSHFDSASPPSRPVPLRQRYTPPPVEPPSIPLSTQMSEVTGRPTRL